MVDGIRSRLATMFSRPAEREPVAPSAWRTGLAENGRYVDFCWRAATDDLTFARFRRDPAYTSVLGLDAKWGPVYLESLPAGSRAARLIPEAARSDGIGDPVTITLPDGNAIAPTTLRYLKVADDLERLFGDLDGARVCEIGGGYGGQCLVLDAMWQLDSYTLVDLRPALLLADRFLAHFPLRCRLELRTMNELGADAYDLFVSNYAYSELTGPIQEAYYERAIARSSRGFVLFNDLGRSQLGPGRMTADDLCRRVSGQVLPEQPETHPRNCLVVWGATHG